MAQSTTPSASRPAASSTTPHTPVLPRTPNSSLDNPSARTPGASLRTCSSDPAHMTTVKVHTAKCTECDKRNKDTMLRCPGCTFQICKPCRERREKKGKGLMHGSMLSPGGLGLGSGLGTIRRKIVGVMNGTAVPPLVAKEDEDMVEVVKVSKGKGKALLAPTLAAKPASKRHPAKPKSKSILSDESSGDDFMPDPASPTSNKRQRTALTMTDTPTATSARPSRTAPLSASTPTYIAPSSPDSNSDSCAEIAASSGRPSTLNSQAIKTAWDIEIRNVIPTGRIQELLEQHGVNTPGNRYEQHFLSRYEPVVADRVISIPEAVRRMVDAKPRLCAEEMIDVEKGTLPAKSALDAQVQTVRGFAKFEATRYWNHDLSSDENEEMASAIKEVARKWAMRTHDSLPLVLQIAVLRSLDMRLDRIDGAYKAQLVKAVEECAGRKLKEFEQDRYIMATQTKDDGTPEGRLEEL